MKCSNAPIISKKIAQKIDTNLDNNQELTRFLNMHFQEIDKHGQLMLKTVSNVDVVLSDSLVDLRNNVSKNIGEMLRFSDAENNRLQQAMTDNRTNLSNLQHLSSINEGLKQLNQSNAQLATAVQEQTRQLGSKIEKLANSGLLTRFAGWILPKK